MSSVVDILFSVRSKGARIWLESEQLQYRAPRGALTLDEIAELRARRSEIISFLRSAPSSSAVAVPLVAQRTALAPLTPYQDWRCRMLSAQYVTRLTKSVRCLGVLNIPALQQSFVRLVHRHEALRSTVTLEDGVRHHRVGQVPEHVLDVVDISGATLEEGEANARAIVQELGREKVDPAQGPLFLARLLQLGEQDHVLVVSIYSLLSDATSASIFWRDLWTLYTSIVAGLPDSLPGNLVQPADYAAWHRDAAPSWQQRHGQYWSDRLSGAQRATVFGGHESHHSSHDLSVHAFSFGKDLRDALSALSARRKTSLGMAVMAAFAAMNMRCCDTNDLVISVHTSGRLQAEVENSIGRFQCPLFLRLELSSNDRLVDLLANVAEEYDRAYEHHDLGRLFGQDLGRSIAANPNMNWVPLDMVTSPQDAFDKANAQGSVERLELRSFESYFELKDAAWQGEPMFACQVTDAGLTTGMVFRSDCVTSEGLDRIRRNFHFFLSKLATSERTCVSELACLS